MTVFKDAKDKGFMDDILRCEASKSQCSKFQVPGSWFQVSSSRFLVLV